MESNEEDVQRQNSGDKTVTQHLLRATLSAKVVIVLLLLLYARPHLGELGTTPSVDALNCHLVAKKKMSRKAYRQPARMWRMPIRIDVHMPPYDRDRLL